MRAILVNGSIFGFEGDSLIVSEGIIVKVGYESSLTDYFMSEGLRKIDLEGSSIIPSLHDSHTHVPLMGPNTLDLRGIRSIDELKEKVRRWVLRNKAFIYGRGWDHTIFKEHRYPTRWDIDPFTGDIPAVLVRVCGHVALLNTKAVRLLHDRFGNRINEYLIKEDGRPSGIVIEEGVDLARTLIPKPTLEEIRKYIINYVMEYISLGVTHLNIMSVSKQLMDALSSSGVQDLINIGVYLTPETASEFVSSGRINKGIRLCGVKGFADGSFGGRTAHLRKGYRDGGKGKLLLSEASFKQLYSLSHKLGGQLAIHAIGDGAIEAVLNYALRAGIPRKKLRIEHASLTPPDIIDKLSLLKPHVVVQPHFLVSDWWLSTALKPSDLRWVYSFKSLMNAGLNLYASSDFPVEPRNPYLGVSSAVSRGMLQAYTYEETLSTENAFQAYFGDPCFGSSIIKEGVEANLVVLDENINSLHGYDVAAIKPKLVLSAGNVIYVSSDFQSKVS